MHLALQIYCLAFKITKYKDFVKVPRITSFIVKLTFPLNDLEHPSKTGWKYRNAKTNEECFQLRHCKMYIDWNKHNQIYKDYYLHHFHVCKILS